MKSDGPIIERAGIRHSGTVKFLNKVDKGRKRSKAAKASRRRNRGKK